MSCSRTMAQMWQQVDHLKDVIRKQHDKAEKRNAEIKALKAENARLRESLEYANNEWEKESMEYLSTQVENAKLRELLQRALTSHNKMCTNRGTCLECLLFNAKPFEPACPIVSVTRDARELGIEV